jgi:large subunit ribosomal protein L30
LRQKLTLEALGFTKKGRMHKVIEHEATPQIVGMVKKIGHLVKIVD